LPVGRRAVGVLRVLLEHAGSPVSKDALMLAAWRFGSRGGQSHCADRCPATRSR
jgi:DNA-binding winged helix-turn-helix (wHTH) protein